MRGKFFVIFILLIGIFSLTACVRVIRSPSDELRMYVWSAQLSNGNTAELRFDGAAGCLSVDTGDRSLELHGLCVVTDDRMIICDEGTAMNYAFGYTLYGDRVELLYHDSVLSLEKEDTAP